MPELTAFIESQITVAPNDLLDIVSRFTLRVVRKNKHLLKQGQIASEYLFIRHGGLRIYSVFNDQEITGWIAFEGAFFCELTSLKAQQPSRFNIQAIEDTEIMVINHLAMERLYSTYPVWQAFGRKIWETAFQNVVEGIISYQTMTARERYEQLLNQADFVQRVPLKHLASFLGITPTSLSRLRKKIR